MTPTAVEQVFLERRGGGVTVLLVLEDEAGARTRERLPLPVNDLESATRQAARQLRSRGVRAARRVRLRVAGGGGMQDDAGLLRILLEELGG